MKLESVKTLIPNPSALQLPPFNQGWNSEKPEFAEIVRLLLSPKVVVEVGSWFGQSALRLAALCPDAAIICVDTWLASFEQVNLTRNCLHHGYPLLYYQFLCTVAKSPFSDRIFPLPQTSRCAARLLKTFPVKPAVVYVDGSHETPDVYEDCCDYFALLEPGGLIFGDDFENPKHPDVKGDVVRFAGELKLQLRSTNNFWYARKAA